MSLHRTASNLASKGRNGDTMLVHMSPEEVGGLHALALSAYGKPLTINPETGIVEASLLKRLLPTIAGAVVGSVIPGAGTLGAALAGGIASGMANGWNWKSVGGGMLGGGVGKDLAQRLAVAGTPATPATAPSQGTAPASEVDMGQVLGDIHASTPAAASTPAGASQVANQAVAKANATPVKPTLKNVGEGIRSILMDQKARDQFTKENFWPIAGALASYSLIPERYMGPKATPARFWKQNFHRGTKVNPLWQTQQGQPYWTDQYWDEGHYTTEDPFATGYASGGSTTTEQPIKDVPEVVMTPPAAAPAAPTQRYYSQDYKSSYHDPLMAYIDAVNARRKPVPKTSTETGIAPPPTGGGSGTASGGGSTPGSAPAGVVPPPTTTVGEAPESATGTSYTGNGTIFDIAGGYGTPIQTGLNTMPSNFGTQYTPANEVGVNHAPTGSGFSNNTTSNTMKWITDAFAIPGDVKQRALEMAVNNTPGLDAATKNRALEMARAANNPAALLKFKDWLTNLNNGTYKKDDNNWLDAAKKGLDALASALGLGKKNPPPPQTPADEVGVNHAAPVTVTQGGGGLGLGGGFNGSGGGTGSWGGIQLPPGSVQIEMVPDGPYGDPHGGKARGGRIGYAGGGGIASLGHYSDGGRLLRGPGDGVSDDIPAMINRNDGSQQEARLADGEFVFPARIVSEIGNGSTEAGAQKLYAIMDKIQKDRSRSLKDVAIDSNAERHFASLMA